MYVWISDISMITQSAKKTNECNSTQTKVIHFFRLDAPLVVVINVPLKFEKKRQMVAVLWRISIRRSNPRCLRRKSHFSAPWLWNTKSVGNRGSPNNSALRQMSNKALSPETSSQLQASRGEEFLWKSEQTSGAKFIRRVGWISDDDFALLVLIHDIKSKALQVWWEAYVASSLIHVSVDCTKRTDSHTAWRC